MSTVIYFSLLYNIKWKSNTVTFTISEHKTIYTRYCVEQIFMHYPMYLIHFNLQKSPLRLRNTYLERLINLLSLYEEKVANLTTVSPIYENGNSRQVFH